MANRITQGSNAKQKRIDDVMHPPQYLTDGDLKTTWISKAPLDFSKTFDITIDLENGDYEVGMKIITHNLL